MIKIHSFLLAAVILILEARHVHNKCMEKDQCQRKYREWHDCEKGMVYCCPEVVPEIHYEDNSMLLLREKTTKKVIGAATLLNKKIAVTAAHIVKGFDHSKITVTAGLWDLEEEKKLSCFPGSSIAEFQERFVDRIIVHEKFKGKQKDSDNTDLTAFAHDIALIMLQSQVDTSRYNASRISMSPPPSSNTEWHNCYATGLDGTKTHFQKFKKANMTLEDCEFLFSLKYQRHFNFTNTAMICAKGEEGEDTCPGDGGGPLICQLDGKDYLVGITSWGAEPCGQPGMPGVYTDVSHFIDWIEKNKNLN